MAILIPPGLQFPSSQVPSSDPNVLDDYEEGSWVPALSAATTPPTGVVYTNQMGHYTKIGRLVFAAFRTDLSSLGSSGVGNVRIEGLPFAIPTLAHVVYCGTVQWEAITLTGFTTLGCTAQVSGTTFLSFSKLQLVGANVALTWADLSATSRLRGEIVYATEYTS